MTLFSTLLGFTALGVIISCIMYVIFGQRVVRRLRKNPETWDKLGVSFLSGYDILNVAGALSAPRCIVKRLENGGLSPLFAQSDILYKHTTKAERIFAKIFYFSFMGSASILMILCIFGFIHDRIG